MGRKDLIPVYVIPMWYSLSLSHSKDQIIQHLLQDENESTEPFILMNQASKDGSDEDNSDNSDNDSDESDNDSNKSNNITDNNNNSNNSNNSNDSNNNNNDSSNSNSSLNNNSSIKTDNDDDVVVGSPIDDFCSLIDDLPSTNIRSIGNKHKRPNSLDEDLDCNDRSQIKKRKLNDNNG